MKTPTLKEIKKDYAEVVSIFMNVRDFKTLKEYQKKYKVSIEMDSMPIIEFSDPYDFRDTYMTKLAEVVRVECWNNLGYIYFNYSNPEMVSIYFDVYSEDIDEYFIDSATYDTLEEEYINGLLWIIRMLTR